MTILIQDIYTLGVRLHQILVAGGMNRQVLTSRKFHTLWNSARSQLKKELEADQIDLIGPRGAIDWNLYFDRTADEPGPTKRYKKKKPK